MGQNTNDVVVDNALKAQYKVESLVQSDEAHRQIMVDVGQTQIPPHDYVALTYVAAGNGTGEIETATYKSGGASGTEVAVVTLTYDANDKLSTVTTVIS